MTHYMLGLHKVRTKVVTIAAGCCYQSTQLNGGFHTITNFLELTTAVLIKTVIASGHLQASSHENSVLNMILNKTHDFSASRTEAWLWKRNGH